MGNSPPPKKPHNLERRVREHLTPAEVERLLAATKKMGDYGHRNYTAMLLAYRHALRVSELVDLRWTSVAWEDSRLFVRRLKRGIENWHPITADELKALKRLHRQKQSDWILEARGGQPMSRRTFYHILKQAGEIAGFVDFPIHPHMLRHSCGYAMAASGIDTLAIKEFLGHRRIDSTTIYTQLAPGRFNTLGEWWKK